MTAETTLLERANRLKNLRLKCNFSKFDLSRQTGFPPQRISKWELGIEEGISEVDASLLISSLKTIVNCDLRWLWSGKGGPPILIKKLTN